MVPTAAREVAASSWGARSIRMPKASSTSGHGIADLAEGAGHHGVHDGSHGARHPPPLAGGDDDGEGDEQQAEAVAAVLGLEVAAGVADLAGHGAGGVGQAHPGALHGAQRQRQATGAGAGGSLAGPRGGSPVRRPGRGAPAARRGGRASRHGRRLRDSHTGLTCHTRHGGDNRRPDRPPRRSGPERGPRPDECLLASPGRGSGRTRPPARRIRPTTLTMVLSERRSPELRQERLLTVPDRTLPCLYLPRTHFLIHCLRVAGRNP